MMEIPSGLGGSRRGSSIAAMATDVGLTESYWAEVLTRRSAGALYSAGIRSALWAVGRREATTAFKADELAERNQRRPMEKRLLGCGCSCSTQHYTGRDGEELKQPRSIQQPVDRTTQHRV